MAYWSSPSQIPYPSRSLNTTGETPHMDVPEGFDVDESELIQLYKRIPPPDLRAYALNVARERVVTDVVRKVKEDGVFDSFRKTWLKDLEAKPQFQNLVRRVEIRCGEYLKNVKWSPDINKTHLREKLQHFIESLSFVDAGIRDLLAEITTGVYANPIPIDRFEEAVTRIVGEMVQRSVQGSTPQFPQLRKIALDNDLEGASSTTSDCTLYHRRDSVVSQSSSNPNSEDNKSKPQRPFGSRSPDLVDMEISSPEGSNVDVEESEPSSGPTEPFSDRSKLVEPVSMPSDTSQLSPIALPPVAVDESNDDRVEGAMVLLMLASGKDWNNSPKISPLGVADNIVLPADSPVDGSLTVGSAAELFATYPPPPPPPPPPLPNCTETDVVSVVVSSNAGILVNTEPVSREPSPNRMEGVVVLQKTDAKPYKEVKRTAQETLYDTIESGSDDEKREGKVKKWKEEPQLLKGAEAASSSLKAEKSFESIMVAPKRGSPFSDYVSSRKTPENLAVDPLRLIDAKHMESRIIKISTERMPLARTKSFKRSVPKESATTSKLQKSVFVKKGRKSSTSSTEASDKTVFVPIITDFTMDPVPMKVQRDASSPVELCLADPDNDKSASTGTVDTAARPTRQRKTNTKYCNDAFVSVPPLPKRMPAVKKSKGDVGIHRSLNFDLDTDDAASSPRGSQVESGSSDARGGSRKRKT